MLQKIKFHFAGSDEPHEFVKEDINLIPEKPVISSGSIASIELDVLLTSAQDINDLMFKLSKLQELFGESGVFSADDLSSCLPGRCSCTTNKKSSK